MNMLSKTEVCLSAIVTGLAYPFKTDPASVASSDNDVFFLQVIDKSFGKGDNLGKV